MGIEDTLGRMETMLADVLSRLDGKADSHKIDSLMEAFLNQRTIKDFYSTAEVAEMVGRSEFQVRCWCRDGRVKAIKRACGRGSHKSWMVSHEEVDRYKTYGLRPV